MKIRICFLCFMMLGCGLLRSANGTSMPKEEMQHEVAVTLKLVQVFVLDKNGDPVKDLRISDFTVYDNGQPKKITEFERYTLSASPEEVKTITDMLPPSSRDVPSMNRKFFFLFDVTRTKMDGLKVARDAALHFLDTKIQPQDEVGILAFSAHRDMIILQQLTQDHEETKRNIQDFIDVAGRPVWSSFTLWREQALAFRELEEARSTSFRDYDQEANIRSMVVDKDPEMYATMSKNFEYLNQMEDVARNLREIPGFKNIILFSGGFLGHYQSDPFFSRSFDGMAKAFASANSPIHAINTEGTRQFFKPLPRRGDGELKNLSHFSGGKYFRDVKRYEFYNQSIQDMTGNYYVLGYYIDEKADGKYHDIKVEVEGSGLEVIAQSGYYSPKSLR
ncbi:MAG: VWA domain-containing protein [Deltaproteobacteria bacterium]|nr:VWA domain-containing protein [Deltaproteobacteria bacterium]